MNKLCEKCVIKEKCESEYKDNEYLIYCNKNINGLYTIINKDKEFE